MSQKLSLKYRYYTHPKWRLERWYKQWSDGFHYPDVVSTHRFIPSQPGDFSEVCISCDFAVYGRSSIATARNILSDYCWSCGQKNTIEGIVLRPAGWVSQERGTI